MAAAGFLSHYMSGILPYVRRSITVNMLSASLNNTFPCYSSLNQDKGYNLLQQRY